MPHNQFKQAAVKPAKGIACQNSIILELFQYNQQHPCTFQ